MQKTTTRSSAYKYRLHELLLKLSVTDYRAAKNYLPVQLGVEKRTFVNWIYIKQDDTQEITPKQLMKLASFFEIDPIEMFTVQPKNISLEHMREQSRKDLFQLK